jgi:hypothetical protein
MVMDANIATHALIYEKALGHKPHQFDFLATDGAPIERTHLTCSAASRKHWMNRGKLLAKPSLVNAMRELISWAKADPSANKLGIITFKPLRLALESILMPEATAVAEEWACSGQSDDILEELKRRLGPILAQWDGEILLGHYGAVRGLNTMSDADCLATLGDPWPDIGQVGRDVAYLDMSDEAEARMEALCRAELEQAHGRLRTVHRTRPGRALHVGRVLPSGSGWCRGGVIFKEMPNGRPGALTPMSVEELESVIQRFGGLKATASQAACSAAYLSQCRKGKRPVSQRLAEVLRRVMTASGEGQAEVQH